AHLIRDHYAKITAAGSVRNPDGIGSLLINRPTPNPSQEGSNRPASDPSQEESNRLISDPSQEGKALSSAPAQLASREASGAGSEAQGGITAGSILAGAVKAALKEIIGTYGIAVVCADCPDLIVGARRGSPLIVGVGA